MKFLTCVLYLAPLLMGEPRRWTEKQAGDWYRQQPWLVGTNYIPASAINQLEMWQAATFDPKRIDLELGWAQSLGMNTMRVFLHDLLWRQDAAGFRKRVEIFLTIAHSHGIHPMFVLFDSCWDPVPVLGSQRPPRPGIHNSGWVQSPGAQALMDSSQVPRLQEYTKGIIAAFAKDSRVLAWDLWNEPDNTNVGSYGQSEPKDKEAAVARLLPLVYQWARSAQPIQPLTSGLWRGNWSDKEHFTAIQRVQLDQSDILTFHSYSPGEKFGERVKVLQAYGRPILCTEYMARGAGSTFQGTLPIALKNRVGVINWGLVAGKTQTYLPWDSWAKPYVDREPAIWFHEVFRTDGTPYLSEEVDYIRRITAEGRRLWSLPQRLAER